jgi:MFS family permease
MLAAASTTTLGALPIFLLSAQAVLLRRDLGFTEFQLGLAVTVFFSAAALASVPAGRVAEWAGKRVSTTLAGLLATASLLGIALIARSYGSLLALLVLGGIANAASQMSANLLLAEAVPARRQGLAFGIKQSAIPISTLIGGVTVPVVGLTLGWRWAYVCAAVVALAVTIAAPRAARSLPASDQPPATRGGAVTLAPLLVIAIGTAFASAATNAMGAFLVTWSVEVGLGLSAAGVLLAVSSALSIAVRVASGAAADWRTGHNLPVVAAQLVVGALAVVLLSTGGTVALVSGALLAFGIGWSWPGLLIFAVVRAGREAPTLAASIVQAGAFIGGASGPGLFGLLVHAWSYIVAWRTTAAGLLVAAVLVLIGRQMILAELVRRPGV